MKNPKCLHSSQQQQWWIQLSCAVLRTVLVCAALQKTKDLHCVSCDRISPFQTGKCFLREPARPDEQGGFGCEFISSCSSRAAAGTTMPIGAKKKKNCKHFFPEIFASDVSRAREFICSCVWLTWLVSTSGCAQLGASASLLLQPSQLGESWKKAQQCFALLHTFHLIQPLNCSLNPLSAWDD